MCHVGCFYSTSTYNGADFFAVESSSVDAAVLFWLSGRSITSWVWFGSSIIYLSKMISLKACFMERNRMKTLTTLQC